MYDRACLKLGPEEIAAREEAHVPRAVRFKVPTGQGGQDGQEGQRAEGRGHHGKLRFDDLVHGPIEFDTANIEDFVIVRSDGHPTYHLSVVSDDIEMGITHVVRGDDHISNTPKHVLLYRALGAAVPQFAHVPLILGPDKKRLSKRHGATSVMEYAHQGFLPEAMVNFLGLLGWSPGAGDRELFTRDELVAAFGLERISGGNAVFNPEKLDWFNQQHIALLAPDDLALRLKPLFEGAGLWDDAYLGDRHAWFLAVLELLKPRAKRLPDFLEQGRFFFTELVDYDPAAVAKHLRAEGMREHLAAIGSMLAELGSFDPESIEAGLRGLAEARGVKAATLIHAVRVAVTGRSASPGLFEVLTFVGRDRSRARLTAAGRLIASQPG
jgi:glutamyl-tRNA synthetase